MVTGLGVVGSFGTGLDALATRLAAGPVAGVEVDRAAGRHRAQGARTALTASSVDLAPLLTAGQGRRMSPPARFAVSAMRLALADAGLAGLDEAAHAATGVVLGTSYGPAFVTEQLLGQIFGSGPESASPAAFTESVASASAAQMALAIRARGPNLAITQREASELLALAEGVRLVETGAAERMLVVAVDEMTPLLHAVLDRFRALARSEADGREAARPFDRRRSGALASEGAAVLVLEPEEAAAARGATIRARVAARVRGFDPTAPAWDWGGDSEALAATLRRGLARARVDPGSIDRVVSGASGTRRGDALEAAILLALFDRTPPPILAPKATLGDSGGGLLAAALLAVAGRKITGHRDFEPDPELGIELDAAARLPPPARTLVSSLASGGAAAWVLLERSEPSRSEAV